MRPGTGKRTFLLFFGGLFASGALAHDPKTAADETLAMESETAPGNVALELYSPPRVVSKAAPRYPLDVLRKGGEGWARLHFMVDTSGRPYEIAVTDSVGDRVFRNAAVRALEESTFDPARLDGKTIDAGHSMYFNFESRRNARARRWFARTHRLTMKAIEAGDREEADRLFGQLESVSDRNWSIRKMGVLNLVEDASLHVAKYAYFAKWGDQRQQLYALDRAVRHMASERRLPKLLYASLHRVRFELLVQTQDFQRAIETFETLAKHPAGAAIPA